MTQDITPRITQVHLSSVIDVATATPWAITPEKLLAIQNFLAVRSMGERVSAEEIEQITAAAQRRSPTGASREGTDEPRVAVISVTGTLLPRATGLARSSGVMTTGDIADAVEAAVMDGNVSAVVLDIDSPGGVTTGIPDAASRIMALRGRKPIVAVANDLMASAAYWLGSAADEIVASPTALVGSIGVYTMHVEASRMLANAGMKVTIVKAGRLKAGGNPYEELSPDARDTMQAIVSEAYDRFVEAVATQRNTSAEDVIAKYGEGSVLTPSQALKVGMVDRVATLQDTLRRVAASTSSAASGRPSRAPTAAHPPVAGEGTSTGSPLALDPAPVAEEPVVSMTTQAPPAGGNADAEDRKARLNALATRFPQVVTMQKYLEWDQQSISAHAAEMQVMELLSNASKATVATNPSRTTVSGLQHREEKEPFAHAGEFYSKLAATYTPGGDQDIRILAAASGMNQSTPSQGKVLVPQQFANRLIESWQDDPEDLISRTDVQYIPDGVDSIVFPALKDNDRSDGSLYGGIITYWLNEADQINYTKAAFRDVKIEPQEVGAILPVTDKLLRNAPSMGQFAQTRVPKALRYKMNGAVFGGDGAGKPKGFARSACRVTIAKESGQPAGTIVPRNLSKMWAALPPGARSRAIWLHNVDVEPALDELSTLVANRADTENVGGYQPRFYNPDTRTIKGRPLIPSAFCETLGTEGDLVLIDPLVYCTGLGSNGAIDAQVSIHVRFEYAESLFRFMASVDGQPWLDAPLTPLKGKAGAKLSPIVTLATRA